MFVPYLTAVTTAVVHYAVYIYVHMNATVEVGHPV